MAWEAAVARVGQWRATVAADPVRSSVLPARSGTRIATGTERGSSGVVASEIMQSQTRVWAMASIVVQEGGTASR